MVLCTDAIEHNSEGKHLECNSRVFEHSMACHLAAATGTRPVIC